MSNKENTDSTKQHQTAPNSTDILCHRCRWGAAPGKLTRCNCPAGRALFDELCRRSHKPGDGAAGDGAALDGVSLDAAAWALPSVAAASGRCPQFSPPA